MVIPPADVTNQIASDPLITIGAFVLAAISVFLAVFFYHRGRRVKAPRYMMRSENLFADLKDIQILHSGRQITNLTVTKLLFWNNGREPIKTEDVGAPLALRGKGGVEFLDVKKIHENNPDNNFALVPSPDRSSIQISFRYIDHNDAVLIHVFHTGKPDDEIALEGKVIGAGPPVLKKVPTRLRSDRERMTFLIAGIAMLIFGVSIFGYFLTIPPTVVITPATITPSTQSTTNPPVAGGTFLFLFGLFGLLSVYQSRRRVPSGFESFLSTEYYL